MQIKQIIKYQFDGYQFDSEEEAKQFVALKEREDQLFKSNYEKLGGWKPENYSIPIPVKYTLDDSEIKVGLMHWKDENDSRNCWFDLLNNTYLRYIESEIQIIDNKEFLDIYLYATYIIRGENFNTYLSAIAAMTQKYPEYAQKILDKLSTTQFSPVFEYRD